MIRDVVLLVGLGTLGVGLYERFGWDVACIVVGATLVALAVVGAIRQ